MKILALNLTDLGPSSKYNRAEKLLNYISKCAADVLVLSRFKRTLFSTPFSEGLKMAGFGDPAVSDGNLGVAIYSRPNAARIALSPPTDKGGIAALSIGKLTVVGVYLRADDTKNGTNKIPFYEYLLSQPKAFSGPLLVMGTFNTGINHVDVPSAAFSAEEYFRRLTDDLGWVDLWRAKHGDKREYTIERPYRVDHAFAAGGVENNLRDCDYDHAIRNPDGTNVWLSDNSAMIVEIE